MGCSSWVRLRVLRKRPSARHREDVSASAVRLCLVHVLGVRIWKCRERSAVFSLLRHRVAVDATLASITDYDCD